MAAEEGNIITFIFTGEEERNASGIYIIPRNATHVSIHPSVKVIPARLFQSHKNIIEIICHAGVEKIELNAFFCCRRLRRVIIPGVKVVKANAFYYCEKLVYIVCDKLERIGGGAFTYCKSLSNINLPSAKIVEKAAFIRCKELMDVKFGKSLESIGKGAFIDCSSLERITIPLKNGLIAKDRVFVGCENLKSADLVEETVLRETIAALHFEEWRNDLEDDINLINQSLPNAPAGILDGPDRCAGRKATVIRDWIERVLRKVIHYKAQHELLLTEAASALQLALPNDIVMNNVIPFLELPLYTFVGEERTRSRAIGVIAVVN